jgi:hypothetical protein
MAKENALKAGEAQQVEQAPQKQERRKRRRRPVRGKTLQVRKMPKEYRRLLGLLYPEPEFEYVRAQTRAECKDTPRPCPFVSCRYHLYMDVNEEKRNGAIKINFPDLDVHEMEHTCVLDLAEGGPRTLDEVGEYMNLTRERVRQIEEECLNKLGGREAAIKFLEIGLSANAK